MTVREQPAGLRRRCVDLEVWKPSAKQGSACRRRPMPRQPAGLLVAHTNDLAQVNTGEMASMDSCCTYNESPCSMLEHKVVLTRGTHGETNPVTLDGAVRTELAKLKSSGLKEAVAFCARNEVIFRALFVGEASEARSMVRVLDGIRKCDSGKQRVYLGRIVWEISGQTLLCDGPWAGGVTFARLKPFKERRFLEYIHSDAFAGKIATSHALRPFLRVEVIFADEDPAPGVLGNLKACLPKSQVAIIRYIANPWLTARGTASVNSENSDASLHEQSMERTFQGLLDGAKLYMVGKAEFLPGEVTWHYAHKSLATMPQSKSMKDLHALHRRFSKAVHHQYQAKQKLKQRSSHSSRDSDVAQHISSINSQRSSSGASGTTGCSESFDQHVDVMVGKARPHRLKFASPRPGSPALENCPSH